MMWEALRQFKNHSREPYIVFHSLHLCVTEPRGFELCCGCLRECMTAPWNHFRKKESRQLTCSLARLRFFCYLWLWFDLGHCVLERMGSGCVIHSVSHWIIPLSKRFHAFFLFALICRSPSACDIFITVIIPYEAERER